MNELQSCNKTAIILPEQICDAYIRQLRSSGHLHPHIFVGTETYSSSMSLAFSLRGLVPRYVIRSLKGIQSSGVWESWWEAFAKKEIEKDLTFPTTATMQGNILIIFHLLIGGLIVSVAFFATEILSCCVIRSL